jgi:hypothetical protein
MTGNQYLQKTTSFQTFPAKMRPVVTTSTTDLPPAKARALRARSLPTSRPFTVAVFFTSLHYLGVIATSTSFALLVSERSQLAAKVFVAGLAFSAVTWLIAFFKRRSAFCPLCKGTPLINSGALAHSKATRIPPFNHGVSATLSILATQRFCCMYCGSDFDLLKTPSHLRDKSSGDKD